MSDNLDKIKGKLQKLMKLYEDGRKTEINKQLEENKKAQINKVKFLD